MLFISLGRNTLSIHFHHFALYKEFCKKIHIDQATGIIIVPNWPTETWWPYRMSMLINYPIILPRKARTLFLTALPQEIHPLHKKLELLACHFSGTSCLSKEFQKKLQRTGTQKQYRTYLERWKSFCTSRKVNPLCQSASRPLCSFSLFHLQNV